MRVTTGNNPYAHQQQRANNKDKGGFADMLANMAANKSGKTGASGDGGLRTRPTDNNFLHRANLHRPNETESKLEMGQLVLAKAPCTAELVVSEPYKAPPPKYPASIYDIPASELQVEIWAAKDACSQLDTEGLSKAEIYSRLESIYQDYLGKDFRDPSIVYSGTGRNPNDSYMNKLCEASLSFSEELCKVNINGKNGVGYEEMREIIRESKGYKGMSESEMRAAVREKYPEKMTLKDCILMADEMWQLGLDDTNYGNVVKDRIRSTLNIDPHQDNGKTEKIFDSMLEMPANYDTIKTAYTNFAQDDFNSYPTHNMDDTFSKLLSWFGGNEFGGGALLNQLRAMLDEMEKSGELVFDQFGYCRSPEKV